MKKKILALAGGVSALPLLAEDATATLPDIGFNIGDYISVAITNLGGPLKLCVGLAFVSIIVWAGVKWLRRGSK